MGIKPKDLRVSYEEIWTRQDEKWAAKRLTCKCRYPTHGPRYFGRSPCRVCGGTIQADRGKRVGTTIASARDGYRVPRARKPDHGRAAEAADARATDADREGPRGRAEGASGPGQEGLTEVADSAGLSSR